MVPQHVRDGRENDIEGLLESKPMSIQTRTVRPANRRDEAAEQRRRRILHHAREMLVREGYFNTSLNRIIHRAGGSKAGITRYFGDKAGLVAAVLEEVTGEFVVGLAGRSFSGAPEPALRRIGAAVLRFYLRPDALSVYRSVVGEGFRHRRLGEIFYRAAHGAVVRAVAARLAFWHERGQIRSDDPLRDADRFLHALRSGPYEQALLGLRSSVSRREIDDTVLAAVRGFLNGARPATRRRRPARR